jgi:hypothetical protein
MTFERYVDDRSDLEARAMRPSRVLQALSPELAPGSDWSEARPGDLMISFPDRSEQLFPRVPGVTAQLIASVTQFVEWGPERGAMIPPVDVHDFAPLDAQWIDAGGRKACLRPNGNRIDRTIFTHMLVDDFPATFAFKSTALEVGERLARDSDKVRVEVDGETVRVVGAFYRLSSELERNDRGQTWWKPTFERLGVLGQEKGPTLAQVRIARDLRFEFKADEEKRKALSAPSRTPVLSAPEPQRGKMTFTSGLASNPPRSWADPKNFNQPQPAQPAQTVDPKLNDDIPWSE